MRIWLIVLRWRCRWLIHEWLVMRPAYAVDQALLSVAMGHEADAHYGERSCARVDVQRYATGLIRAMWVRRLPEHFLDTWFR
jgi:hypothetical protein